jgi:hypothetical protein
VGRLVEHVWEYYPADAKHLSGQAGLLAFVAHCCGHVVIVESESVKVSAEVAQKQI